MSQKIVTIQKFDDGRKRFEIYPNKWKIIGEKFNGSKLILQNLEKRKVL